MAEQDTHVTTVNKESKEIAAIRQNNTYIIDTVVFVGGVQWFAHKLAEKEFIPHQTAGGIVDIQGITRADKAGKLLESVFNKLRRSDRRKQWFDEFIAIFSGVAAYGELVNTLRRSYGGSSEPKIVESKIVETSLSKRGLAIIVTCDYIGSTPHDLPGTNTDAREMRKTFEELDYHVILRQNGDATKHQITSTIESISRDMHLFHGVKDKVVAFVFSGHGTIGDQIVTQDEMYLSLEKMIVKPLLAKRKKCDPPVLFFIDACRGNNQLKLTSGSGQSKFDADNLMKGSIRQEANFRLDYATINNHVSYMSDTSTESRWLPTVARDLRIEKNKPLETIMQDVKKKVYGKYSRKQQPQTLDQLNCGSLYLHSRPGTRLYTILFVYLPIACIILGFACYLIMVPIYGNYLQLL